MKLLRWKRESEFMVLGPKLKSKLKANRSYFLLPLVIGLSLLPAFAANVTYLADSTDFPNPERGFWGSTVSHKYIEMGNYKTTPLSQQFLDGVEKIFNDARNANMKLIPRFRYSSSANSDASLEQMLSHIEQLRPVLARNYDVIAVMEAGFVGAFGEWWGSTSVNTTEARRAILFKLLDVLPKERMVAIRYNMYKRTIYASNEPLTPAEAFTGTNKARTAAQNDCFITDENDAGTYKTTWDGPYGLGSEAEKTFLNSDNLYVSQEGETCQVGSTAYASCTRALTDMARMRWDMINNSFNQSVLSQWKNQGCYDEISKRLGYRIRLLDGSFDNEVVDGNLHGSLHLKNEGFGKIFNPRKLEMVLRNTQNGMEYILPLPQDPRFWSPGVEQSLVLNIPIPKTIPFGTYSLLLNLPDPAPSLYGKPKYSIRLANKNLWEPLKGYNALQQTVKVSSFNSNSTALNIQSSIKNRFEISGPANGQAHGSIGIGYDISKPSQVNITVFDVAGNLVVELVNTLRSPGSYSLSWNGLDHAGRLVHEGVYFVTFRTEGKPETKRVFFQR